MARCGVPTITCVLLLLTMAALYGSMAFGQTLQEPSVHARWPRLVHMRKERSILLPNNVNARGRQGRIADGTREGTGLEGRRRGVGSERPLGRGGRRRGSGRRAGRVALVEGVTRRDMNLAMKLHNASSPFGTRLLRTAFGPDIRYNTILSPYSIHTTLTMASLGARRGTQREMLGTLGLPQVGLRRRMIHRAYKALIGLLSQENNNTRLETANAIYVKPNIPLEANFRQGLLRYYQAAFDTFDYQAEGGPETPINRWVSNVTQGNIPILLQPGTLGLSTAMVLVNAVYFKATFKTAFDKNATGPRAFTTLDGTVKQIPTMIVRGTFRMTEQDDHRVVELPYTGGKHALYVIIPNLASNVNLFLSRLEDTDNYSINPINSFLQDLQPREMTFSIPKFRIDSGSVFLKSHLRAMGIRKAFGGRANFSGISAVNLNIDDVIHKAFIEISEDGTEASAATAGRTRTSLLGTGPLIIDANRPFVYLVRDTQLNTILFMGTYMGQSHDEA